MPPRWPRKPDRADPAYRKLDDRMNFATHVAIFSAVNSGLWFFRVLGTTAEMSTPAGLPATPLVTEIWALILVAHAIFIFAIAKYSDSTLSAAASSGGQGFQPKSEKSQKKSVKSAK